MTAPYRNRSELDRADVGSVERRDLGSLRCALRPARPKVTTPVWILIALCVVIMIVGGPPGVMMGSLLVVMMSFAWHSHITAWLWRRVVLHRGGFTYRTAVSRGSVLFDDVDELFLEVPSDAAAATFHYLRLKEQGGRSHRVGVGGFEAEDIKLFLETVLTECSLCHLASAKQELENGGSLQLGPIALTRQAITLPSNFGKPRQTKWSELEDVAWVGAAFLFRERNNKVSRVLIRDVPHPTLLVALLKELGVWRAAT